MIDPIVLEVLRCKFEAIAEDGARTIIRNAISPVVAESKDCSCAIYSAEGELIVGGGKVQIAFHIGGNGIRAILDVHADTIADGDVFLVNDPYNGGGLHAQDVIVHIPVFVDGTIVAWVGASAHMMDMGGMVPGSFSTSATEVYQEAFRLPPVRLFRQGVEQHDIFAILRNNIRLPDVVEMDLRSLIAGATVVCGQVLRIVGDYGELVFGEVVSTLSDLTEAEVRRRIAELEPGYYIARSWTEWTDDFYHIPCELKVEGGHLTFNYRGASGQTKHYFNSKPDVIKSLLGVGISSYLARGLPFNEGIFRAFDVVCDPGSIVDAQLPAPIGGPHLEVGQNAMEVGVRALNLALAASPQARGRTHLSGPPSSSGSALHTLSGKGLEGEPQGWIMLEGALGGASAAHCRDGIEFSRELVGSGQLIDLVDVEILESWYPIMFEWRRLRSGTGGGGQFSAGRPTSLAYSVAGTKELSLTIMGNRERLPIPGSAGGLPGNITRFHVRRAANAEVEPLACHTDGIRLDEGDMLMLEVSNGGGWGDPLLRDVAQVEREVARGLMTSAEAAGIYGVVTGDRGATEASRADILKQRLAKATPAPNPLTWTDRLREASTGAAGPLAIGIEQRGSVAVSARSDTPLALSPAHWTEGCPRISNFVVTHPDVEITAYLDPVTGYLLLVDVVPTGDECSSASMPKRWTDAAHPQDVLQQVEAVG
ncbi:hydantoinase B/oxoprolinase family protein [Sphingobium sp. CR2-8]|uniref:hydantoinase B/oxoprolinase family protein n=1 Tax=Sphingobium sp. CR2-8 TaxID=1306534 RepID=UPI002DBBAF7B|nr:hydantoinase B/oxoprolinase family protein [Sphingobium sp. CR2-8]MEC3909528.1 hydantoinase B/oxoprolinase family protein [Sphingobium sp. CR2-8]